MYHLPIRKKKETRTQARDLAYYDTLSLLSRKSVRALRTTAITLPNNKLAPERGPGPGPGGQGTVQRDVNAGFSPSTRHTALKTNQ